LLLFFIQLSWCVQPSLYGVYCGSDFNGFCTWVSVDWSTGTISPLSQIVNGKGSSFTYNDGTIDRRTRRYYWTKGTEDIIYNIDLETGNSTIVPHKIPKNTPIQSIVLEPASSEILALTNSELIKINPITGETQRVTSLTKFAIGKGLSAFDLRRHTIYGPLANQGLFKYDFDAGILSNVSLPQWIAQPEYDFLSDRIIGLSKNTNGQFEVVGMDTQSLAFTVLATIENVDATVFTVTAFSPTSGLFVVALGNVSQNNSKLVVVNLKTGEELFNSSFSSTFFIYGLVFER